MNYNTYCIEIPLNYKPRTWSLDELVEMGEDPKKSEEKVVRKKRKFAPLTDIEENSAEENHPGESFVNTETETTPPAKRIRNENPPKTPRRVEFQEVVEIDNNDSILRDVPFLSQPTRNLAANFNNIYLTQPT